MIISINSEKAFNKVQHPFVIKPLNRVGLEGTYLNIIKALYEKPTVNIILSGEKLKTFKVRKETRKSTVTAFIHDSIGSPSHGN